jgi:four helix bundle protein
MPKVDIHERAYKFTLSVLNLVRELPNRMEGQVLGRQLLRSATSIAANIEEAQGGFSKDDFTYKMNIAFKEARETNLWLRLIQDSNLIKSDQIKSILCEATEIRNILGTIVKNSRKTKISSSSNSKFLIQNS